MVQLKQCPKCSNETTCKKWCPKCGYIFKEDYIPDVISGYRIKIKKVISHRNAMVRFSNYTYNKEYKKDATLYVPEVNSIRDMYAVLHELGHIHCKHSEWSRKSTKRIITAEIEAWQYALQCIKSEYRRQLIEEAVNCISSYFPRRFNSIKNVQIVRKYLEENIPITKMIKLVNIYKETENGTL